MSTTLTRRLHELEEEYARERAILFPIRVVWIEDRTRLFRDPLARASGEGEEADGETGQGIGGEVVATVDGGDGDQERIEGDDEAVAFAIRQGDEESPGAGEGGRDMGAGENARMDAVLAEDREIEAAEDGDDGRKIGSGEDRARRIGREVREQRVDGESAGEIGEPEDRQTVAVVVKKKDGERDRCDAVNHNVGNLQQRGNEGACAFDGGAEVRGVEQPAVPDDPGVLKTMIADGGREPVHLAIGAQGEGDGHPIAEDFIVSGEPEKDGGDSRGNGGAQPPGFALRDKNGRDRGDVGVKGDDQPLVGS